MKSEHDLVGGHYVRMSFCYTNASCMSLVKTPAEMTSMLDGVHNYAYERDAKSGDQTKLQGDASQPTSTYVDTQEAPISSGAMTTSQMEGGEIASDDGTATAASGKNAECYGTGGCSADPFVTEAWAPLAQTFGPCDGGVDAINPSACVADSDTATGAYTTQATDASLAGLGIPFAFSRNYTSADTTSGRLGIGWTDNFAISIVTQSNGDVVLHGEDGQQVHYTHNSDGSYTGDPGAVSTLTASGGVLTLTRPDQSKLTFDTQGRLVSEVDRNGQGLHLGYDGSGHLGTVTDAGGRQISFTSNPDGTLSGFALPDGRHVSFSYTNGALTSVTDLRGGTTSYSYDTSKRLATVTDQNNHTQVQNTYGSDGRLTQQLDALNHPTAYAWDPATETETITDARNNAWQDVYSGNVLVKRIDPLGHATVYGYDANNNLTSVQDPNGHTTTMTYDARHNVLTRATPLTSESWTYDALNDVLSHTDGRSNTTNYTYDAVGNRLSMTQPGSVVTSYTYDPAGTGLLFTTTDPRGKVTHYAYNSAGNLTSITTPLGNETTMAYDGSGRLVSSVDPRGNVAGANPSDYTTTYTYDDGDNQLTKTDPLGDSTTWTYDPVGNKTSLTDANSHTSRYSYDANDRLVSVTAPDDTVTAYTYDPVGNLVSRTDANNHVTTYAYDAANELTGTTDPLNRTWSYSYDAAGNRTKATNPAGAYTTYGYDGDNRVNSVAYSDGTATMGFSYDGNGNRASMTDGAGTVSYTYDALDRLTQVARGGDSFTYAYDPAGNVTQRVYPGGTTTDYTYDDDGNLSTATVGGATMTYTYNAAGVPASAALPNGYSEQWEYDRALRVTQVKDVLGSTANWQYDYTLDPVGHALSVTTLDGVENYTYDNRDRLTSVCYQATCPNSGDPYIRWTYDPVGNRLTETRPTGTSTYTYDAADELTQAQSPSGTTAYTYDANGNEISAGADTYTYDLANQLTAASVSGGSASYTYDGDGNRLSATAGGATTNYLWDTNNAMPQLALERDSAGNAIRTYLQANGTVGLVEGGTTYYYTHDRLGSITGLTSASGNTEWKYTYEPYGALRTAVEVDPDAPVNPLNYIGQYEDPTNGFLDLRARQYDQTTGRFLSVDPAPSGPGTPFAGTYEYAGGDPINSYDLDGLRKRPGEYTPAQRRDKWEGNRTRNGGEARCEECGRVVVPGVKLGPGDKIDPNRGEIHHPVPGDNTVPGELLCRQCHLGGRHGQTLKVSPLPGTFTLPGFTPLGGGFSLPGYTPKPSGPEIGGFSFMPPIAKSGGYSIARQFDGYRP